VARRGSRALREPRPGSAQEAWREAATSGDRDRGAPGPHTPDEWIDGGPVREEAERAVGRGVGAAPRRTSRSTMSLPGEVAEDIERTSGPSKARRIQEVLQEAATAYDRERYRDARRLLAPLVERSPSLAAARELYGLTLYRLGRWRDAIRELEAFQQFSASVDQLPVVADAHRALGHHREVDRLWDELRRGGAGVEVLTEGRIVVAGSMADRGDVEGAVRLLEQGPVEVRRPQEHHLRLWYALAATYERAGNVARARALFARLVDADPEFADAAGRLDALN
jgi:tetratricopeptide (TPR) repeat protein